MEKIITAVAKPFSAFPRSTHKFLVEENGTVRVWDAIAGHYTTCHSLSERTQQRIRKLAAHAESEFRRGYNDTAAG